MFEESDKSFRIRSKSFSDAIAAFLHNSDFVTKMTDNSENTTKLLHRDEAVQKLDLEVLNCIRRIRKGLEGVSSIAGECLAGTDEENGADWPKILEKLYMLHATAEDLMLNTQSVLAMGYALNLTLNDNDEDDGK